MALLKQHNIPFQFVPVEKLNRLTSKNHQGVVGYISAISYYKIKNILPKIIKKGKKVIKNNQPINTRAVAGMGLEDFDWGSKADFNP